MTALASPTAPEPRPADSTRGDWDDWYTITPPPPPRPYPPHAPAPGSVVPPQRQPIQHQPFQPPPTGGPPGYEPFRPYQPGPAPGPPRGDRRRSESNAGLWTILLLLLAGVGAGVVLLVTHPFGNHNQRQAASTGTAAASRAAPAGRKSHASGSAKASPASTASGTSSTTATSAAEQRAASGVASMLSQSASDRSAIIGAATDIGNCGPNLNADPKVFADAAASRRTMLASLTSMPGRNTLPPALVSDLSQAWQASITADQAYAQWANDEITQGCVRNDTSDPGYQATMTPNRQATQYKDSFVVLWNPIASGYGLTQYSSDQF